MSRRLLIILFIPTILLASNQPSDTLIYSGKESIIEEAPLDSIISHETLSELLRPLSACTIDHRCYVAQWEIKENSLYLVKLSKEPGSNGAGIHVPLRKHFPESKGPVKAIWFTGTLRVHTGKKSFIDESDLVLVVQVADGIRMSEWYESLVRE